MLETVGHILLEISRTVFVFRSREEKLADEKY